MNSKGKGLDCFTLRLPTTNIFVFCLQMKTSMLEYCRKMPRTFAVEYCPLTQSVDVRQNSETTSLDEVSKAGDVLSSRNVSMKTTRDIGGN